MQTINKKYSNIVTIHNDLFNYVEQHIYAGNNGTSIIVPHVCNNVNTFGAGFAGAIANRYPIVKENYHLLGNKFLQNNLGYVQFIETNKDKTFGHKLIFANMIAQNNIISKKNPRPLNYLALVKCMNQINMFVSKNFNNDTSVEIHAPRFGCGLAGGNWNFVEELISDIWTNIPVRIYVK